MVGMKTEDNESTPNQINHEHV